MSDPVKKKRFEWLTTARDDQLPPNSDWKSWVLCSGRGWGKTRTAAEWLAHEMLNNPGTRWGIVARTASEARNVCVEGQSGLLACLPEGSYKPGDWKRSLGELSLTLTNGARVDCFSGDQPDRLRGPQFCGAWAEEVAAWKRPESFDMLKFCLRLGDAPRLVVSTTPRPTRLMKRILEDPSAVVVRGSTFDNSSNLPQDFLDDLKAKYEGSRLGRQELHAELLDDTGGALWTWELLDACHEPILPHANEIERVLVVVDPAVTATGDENGIAVVARLKRSPTRKHRYLVLSDLSIQGSGEEWAQVAIEAYKRFHASKIFIESNQGGELLRDIVERVAGHHLPIELFSARKSKGARAEAASVLYNRGLVKHVERFAELEEQMCDMSAHGYFGRGSPDRLDAAVHGINKLAESANQVRGVDTRKRVFVGLAGNRQMLG